MVHAVRTGEDAAGAVERLYSAIAKALSQDAAKEALAAQGMTLALRPAEVAAWLPGRSRMGLLIIRRVRSIEPAAASLNRRQPRGMC